MEERWGEVNAGRAAWASAAGDVLADVASRYGAVITYAELAEQVQQRTKLRTRSHPRNWIGSVLGVVVTRCRTDGLPPLTSLVVHRADGGIEPDEGTVKARLACYREYADDVPAAVIAQAEAEAALAAAAAEEAARARQTARQTKPRKPPTTRERRPAAREAEVKICPTCFVQLPASGICDTCS